MERIDNFPFTVGCVYLFAACPRGDSACGIYGIFDRFDEGRIRLEALRCANGDLQCDAYLPHGYRYVRVVRPEEIRDFYFLYGYRRCEMEHSRSRRGSYP